MARPDALERLIDEALALGWRLRVVAEALHGEQADVEGFGAVLRELDRNGPRTVPQLARTRGLARQGVQAQIDALVNKGLVERVDNPAHARSWLVQLSATGRDTVELVKERERGALAELAGDFKRRDLDDAADLVASLRQVLEARYPGRRP